MLPLLERGEESLRVFQGLSGPLPVVGIPSVEEAVVPVGCPRNIEDQGGLPVLPEGQTVEEHVADRNPIDEELPPGDSGPIVDTVPIPGGELQAESPRHNRRGASVPPTQRLEYHRFEASVQKGERFQRNHSDETDLRVQGVVKGKNLEGGDRVSVEVTKLEVEVGRPGAGVSRIGDHLTLLHGNPLARKEKIPDVPPVSLGGGGIGQSLEPELLVFETVQVGVEGDEVLVADVDHLAPTVKLRGQLVDIPILGGHDGEAQLPEGAEIHPSMEVVLPGFAEERAHLDLGGEDGILVESGSQTGKKKDDQQGEEGFLQVWLQGHGRKL